jgi:hypothetical protein
MDRPKHFHTICARVGLYASRSFEMHHQLTCFVSPFQGIFTEFHHIFYHHFRVTPQGVVERT